MNIARSLYRLSGFNSRMASGVLRSLALCLIVGVSVVAALASPDQVQAGSMSHKFRLTLPNGAFVDLKGASVHTAGYDMTDDDSEVSELASDNCVYDANSRLRSGFHCLTNSGCGFATWQSPFLPDDFSSRFGTHNDGQNFLAYLDARYPHLRPHFQNNNIRGFNNAQWVGSVSTICPQGGCDRVDQRQFRIVSYQNPSQDPDVWSSEYSSLRAAEGTGKYPASFSDDVDRLWNQGMNGGGAGRFNQDGRSREMLFNNVGANALHGEVTWTLTIPSNSPQCTDFGTYNLSPGASANVELAPTASIQRDGTLRVMQQNRDADGTLTKQQICWSANGLSNSVYGHGRRVFVCLPTCQNNSTQTGTRTEYLPPIGGGSDTQYGSITGLTVSCTQGSDGNLLGEIRGTVDAFINAIPEAHRTAASGGQSIRTLANSNGLIFTQDAYDNPWNNMLCSTNPSGGVETGTVYPGGDNSTNCGKVSGQSGAAANCLRRVTFTVPPVTPPPTTTAMVCNNISEYSPRVDAWNRANVRMGDVLNFSCGTVAGATRYEFRVNQPNGAVYPLNALATNASGISAYSSDFTVTQNGAHTAQCRACNSTTCTTWGSPPSCQMSFTPGVQPAALVCLSTTLTPATVTRGATQNLTVTCGRVNGATRYRISAGGNTVGYVNQPTTGNATYSLAANTSTVGTNTVTCTPCSGAVDSTCAQVIAACQATYSVREETPQMACVGTTVAPATVNLGSSQNLTITCSRVQGAGSYRVTLPDNTTATVNQPSAGNATYSYNTRTRPAGQQTVTCIPCTGANGSGTCAPVIPACRANFNVQSGTARCDSKTAVYNGQPLTNQAVGRNQNIRYSVRVTISANTTSDVIVSDVFDSSTLMWDAASASPDAGVTAPTAGSNRITINFGRTAGTFTKSYSLKTRDNYGGGTLENTATLTNNGTGTVSQTCGTVTAEIPDIGTSMCRATDGKQAFLVAADGTVSSTALQPGAVAQRGSTLEYRVTVVNNRYQSRSAVRLTDTIDRANMTYVANSFSPAQYFTSYNTSTGLLSFSIPQHTTNLTSANTVVRYRVRVNDVAQPSVITNTVRVTDNGQGATGNQCTFNITRPAQGTASCVSKLAFKSGTNNQPVELHTQTSAASSTFVDKGQQFWYEVTARATEQTTGPVTVRDILSPNLELVSVKLDDGQPLTQPDANSFFTAQSAVTNGTQLSFNLGVMGQSGAQAKKITIAVRVKADAAPGQVNNSAEVVTGSATQGDVCTHKLAVPPDGVAVCEAKEMYKVGSGDALGDKIAADSTLNTGTEFYYVVRVNAPSALAGNVTVRDTLPGGLELVDQGDFAYDENSGVLSKTLEPFTSTQSLKFKVRVKHTIAAGPIKNTATVVTHDREGVEITPAAKCEVTVKTPNYACNTNCTDTAQCRQVNADYVCSTAQGSRCRLDDNQSAEDCQPKTYACNSTCSTDADCRSVNSNYSCADTDDGKRCRLTSNEAATNCLPPVESTPTPVTGCNQVCATNADCTNPSHICHNTGDGSMRCRLESNVDSASCNAPGVSVTQPPAQLPVSGPEDWATWLKAGVVVIGMGALLLLLL